MSEEKKDTEKKEEELVEREIPCIYCGGILFIPDGRCRSCGECG